MDDFCYTDLKKKLDDVRRTADDSNIEARIKESSVLELLQSCIDMLNTGKIALECMKKESCTSSIVVSDLISYEKAVITLFKHCSESNRIYGSLIVTVRQLLTDLFKKTSEMQALVFNILENVKFDFTLEEDLELLLTVLQHIWYGAEAVYNTSNKIMTTNWKMYITMSQRYSSELKQKIINDKPVEFLCVEIKKIVSSFHHSDESSLKLSTYMMSVLVKLCTHGSVLKSHNTLVEFILFLNSYWSSEMTQDVVTIKDRLLQFANQLVLISDETFVKTFTLSCPEIINSNCSSRKISALCISMLLLERFTKEPCDQYVYDIICIIFKLIRFGDSVMCCYNNIDIYKPLLIGLASVILVSDYDLFENVEKTLIKNILNTEYWPAVFSSDLWIIIMRYLPSDMCNWYFLKLAEILEALIVIPCFTQCPQHIYLETLLRRHFELITDKKQLVNTCPQFKSPSVKSAIGIHHVPTLSKYDRLSEMVKIMTTLAEQKNIEHLSGDIVHLWSCIKDDYPVNFVCALIEISISSESLLKKIIPKSAKVLSIRANDTTEIKRCRLRLIRSILLHVPTYQENLVMEIIFKYLFDPHPLVRQWTVETVVYFSSVTGNQNNLISMLFKRPEIRATVTDYLEMKINSTYDHNDFVQYFERLSLYGKFQHKCSFNDKLDKVLDKLKYDVDCLNSIISKTQMSSSELERLKEYSSILNNICKTTQIYM